MSRSKAERVGRRVGSFIATGLTMFVGYAICRWGLLWATAILGAELVGAFALYGASTYPYRKPTA